MKTYRAILFDLFGTVALFDRERLPLFTWNGHTSRSTMGGLQSVFAHKAPGIAFEHFYTALSAVSAELAEVRTQEMKEFSSAHRFLLTLVRAGLDETEETRRLAHELSLVHMSFLAKATTVPATHLALLANVHARCRTALVSNFDHTPTARQIVQHAGATGYFHHIIISEEHGWRKPHGKIFTDALAALGVTPAQALFVGDSPYDDIVGAQGVGMDVAWVNATGAPLPLATPVPTYTIQALPELARILFA